MFKSGNSQAVRLPKEFRVNVDKVLIFQRGDEIVLREQPMSAEAIFDCLQTFPDDFVSDGREDGTPQEREDF